MELTLKEIEVQKLNVQPGDTLIFTCKGDEFDDEVLSSLRKSLQDKFKDKQVDVMVMLMPEDHNINITTVKKTQSYCQDCSCGKKEAAENG